MSTNLFAISEDINHYTNSLNSFVNCLESYSLQPTFSSKDREKILADETFTPQVRSLLLSKVEIIRDNKNSWIANNEIQWHKISPQVDKFVVDDFNRALNFALSQNVHFDSTVEDRGYLNVLNKLGLKDSLGKQYRECVIQNKFWQMKNYIHVEERFGIGNPPSESPSTNQINPVAKDPKELINSNIADLRAKAFPQNNSNSTENIKP